MALWSVGATKVLPAITARAAPKTKTRSFDLKDIAEPPQLSIAIREPENEPL
jgi:hypothetical protein